MLACSPFSHHWINLPKSMTVSAVMFNLFNKMAIWSFGLITVLVGTMATDWLMSHDPVSSWSRQAAQWKTRHEKWEPLRLYAHAVFQLDCAPSNYGLSCIHCLVIATKEYNVLLSIHSPKIQILRPVGKSATPKPAGPRSITTNKFCQSSTPIEWIFCPKFFFITKTKLNINIICKRQTTPKATWHLQIRSHRPPP